MSYNTPLGADQDFRNPAREPIIEAEFDCCELCSGEAKHYFKKFDEWLCDECYNLAIMESLRELSYKTKIR